MYKLVIAYTFDSAGETNLGFGIPKWIEVFNRIDAQKAIQKLQKQAENGMVKIDKLIVSNNVPDGIYRVSFITQDIDFVLSILE